MLGGTMIVCFANIYKYQGVLFEIPKTGGPCPLKKDGEPKVRIGNKFYDLMEEFYSLSEKERESHRIGGGCMRF